MLSYKIPASSLREGYYGVLDEKAKLYFPQKRKILVGSVERQNALL